LTKEIVVIDALDAVKKLKNFIFRKSEMRFYADYDLRGIPEAKFSFFFSRLALKTLFFFIFQNI
jgi:hypothetical protein